MAGAIPKARMEASAVLKSAPTSPRRILIYGVTGSGKSTLAKRVSDATGLPYYPVDDLCWEPNWIEVPAERQVEKIRQVCAEDEWVLDSAYGKWAEVALARADLVVALDFPRWVSLSRLLVRTLQRAVRKTPVCNGNVEEWRQSFSRDSIILWHFKSFTRKRRRIHLWKNDPAMPPFLVFHRQKEVDEWLELATPQA
jgi:adenylate kinase family enzyme